MDEQTDPTRATANSPEATRAAPAETPVIKVDDRRGAGAKARRSKTARLSGSRSGGFDATALEHLVASGSPPGDLPGSAPSPLTVQAPEVAAAEDETLLPEFEATVIEAVEAKPTARDSEDCADQPAPGEDAAEPPAAPLLSLEAVPRTTGKIAKAARRSSKKQLKPRPLTESPVAKSRAGRRGSAVLPAAGRRSARPIPAWWLAGAACGGSALVVIVLLVNLLGGAPGNGPPNSPPDAAAAPAGMPKSLPTFQSELPDSFPAASGVRPMDAQEQARRREGMNSFAEMGRQEEARLREEQTRPKKRGESGDPR